MHEDGADLVSANGGRQRLEVRGRETGLRERLDIDAAHVVGAQPLIEGVLPIRKLERAQRRVSGQTAANAGDCDALIVREVEAAELPCRRFVRVQLREQ